MCKPISSLKLHGWTSLGDDGDASDTRRCLSAETAADEGGGGETGNGALNENVEEDGSTPLAPLDWDCCCAVGFGCGVVIWNVVVGNEKVIRQDEMRELTLQVSHPKRK
jgi:hypothetical protein